MMSWKSPPKALHSFSIPASIFPQARKNPQLPNTQTFFNLPRPKKREKKTFQPSFGIFQQRNQWWPFCLIWGTASYNTPRGKSTVRRAKNSSGKGGKPLSAHTGVKSRSKGKASVSRCYQPANAINVQKSNTSWLNDTEVCLEKVWQVF